MQLSAAKSVYSFQDKYDNFGDCLKLINWRSFQVKKCLVLGFGLGSIPYILEKKLNQPAIHYVGVEKDESVVYLYEKYQADQINSRVQIVIADAFAFLQTTDEQFDLICMDVFLDDIIPEEMQSTDFLVALKNRLTDKGVLLYNRLDSSPQAFLDNKLFLPTFKEVFRDGDMLKIKGNKLFTNRPDEFNS